jgi:zinc transport system substrate-binding protein
MKLKNTIFILIIISFILTLISLKKNETNKVQDNKISVFVSTFALYDIVKNISQDTLNVNTILPFGVDAHAYEPTPKKMVTLSKSALVIYSGAGLESWCKNFSFSNKVLDMSKYVSLKSLDEKHHNHESSLDPHYWLDINNMIVASQTITKNLISIVPKYKELYENNLKLYIKMLKKIDKDYKKTLYECKLNTIIVNHNAYSYLSSKYAFNTQSLSGLSPEAQTSAKVMIDLMKRIKEDNIKTIFFENFASDKSIKSIAKDLSVKVDYLHTLGNITFDEAKLDVTYEELMRENLKKIANALECK